MGGGLGGGGSGGVVKYDRWERGKKGGGRQGLKAGRKSVERREEDEYGVWKVLGRLAFGA